ncbi:MAG: macro domain-containing protein [Blastocatellia bacterium]|nr:macro domain-containing protein [Blastocatellia bacterium]
MELFLVDKQAQLVECWKKEFKHFPEVKIICEDILSVADNTVVSPANSYGFMDGGIDRIYLEYFGNGLQKIVMDEIAKLSDRYVPIGSSLVVSTKHKKIPYLILSPTMVTPGTTTAASGYHAMASTLKAATMAASSIKRVFCPGLGTGIGQVPYEEAAKEMALAYQRWQKLKFEE